MGVRERGGRADLIIRRLAVTLQDRNEMIALVRPGGFGEQERDSGKVGDLVWLSAETERPEGWNGD